VAYLILNKNEEASAAFKRGVRLNPTLAEGYNNL
tara:strand:- start:128 stop:229 length:102 start_codon:yes stop_codon:yes gene_type:complete